MTLGTTGESAVAVCTALDVEYLAVRQHLSGELGQFSERGTRYEVGAFLGGATPCRVYLSLAGRENTQAAVQVERTIAATGVPVVLFVGIAGGRHNAELGDVVAASEVYGYESGADTDAGFLARIKTMQSAFGLVQQAHAVAREDRWQQRIRPASTGPAPKAMVAPVAAGNKVVYGRSSHTARLLERHCGDAQAVEMEGFGALQAAYANTAVEAIVIRGISDVIHDKGTANDRHRQPVAARHAAAFAFELLATLRPGSPARRDGGTVVNGNVRSLFAGPVSIGRDLHIS